MGPDSAQPQLGESRLIDPTDGSPSVAWRTVGASVRGRSHEQREQPCQDAGAVIVTNDGVLIAVVADGAGSADRAEEGSALAVESALGSLEQAVTDGPLDAGTLEAAMAAAFAAARAALGDRAAAEAAPLADFHTTLLCAVVTGDAVTVGHIGDGVAVIEQNGGELETVALPEHGEYANSTYFLTQLPRLAERLHIRSLERSVNAIALTTDGLLDVAFDDPYGACFPWPTFFAPLFERIRREPPELDLTPKLTALLGGAKIRNQTSDDVTLVMAVRDLPAETDRVGSPEPAGEAMADVLDTEKAEADASADPAGPVDRDDEPAKQDDVNASS